jgi:tetratricopeptide (TPR) repeat protein
MTDNAEQLYKRALSEMKKERWLAAIKLLKLGPAVAEGNWRFPWNLGWCYFKLDKFDMARKQMLRANRLAQGHPACKCGLGMVYLECKHFKKAEVALKESLAVEDSMLARAGLALAYLSQGRAEEAEGVHLEGIRLKPRSSRRYAGYAAFLSDVGRKTEAQITEEKARKLRRIN